MICVGGIGNFQKEFPKKRLIFYGIHVRIKTAMNVMPGYIEEQQGQESF